MGGLLWEMSGPNAGSVHSSLLSHVSSPFAPWEGVADCPLSPESELIDICLF